MNCRRSPIAAAEEIEEIEEPEPITRTCQGRSQFPADREKINLEGPTILGIHDPSRTRKPAEKKKQPVASSSDEASK